MSKTSSSPETGNIQSALNLSSDLADVDFEGDFKPMTGQQVKVWRSNNPTVSPWRVLWLQAAVGLSLAALTGWVTGQLALATSVAWGAFAVVLPAIVFVRALGRQMRRTQPGSALLGLMVWELVKVVLTIALLLVAPKVIADLNWLALVAGFVVTMKVYWLAMALGWMQPKSKPTLF